MAEASKGSDGKPSSGVVSEDQSRAAELKRAVVSRQKQSLNLQREQILSQRTSNPGRRSALEAALSQIEAQLAALEEA